MKKKPDFLYAKEYIEIIAKERSFSKAAEKLYISQPALSNTIKKAEERIGFEIFDRTVKPLKLTVHGEEYLNALQQIRRIEDDFLQYLEDDNDLQIGTLTVGGSNFFSSYILPPIIARFLKKYPNIDVNLVEDKTVNLRESALEGSIDLFLDNYDFDEKVFDRIPYRKEKMFLAIPRSFEQTEYLKEYELSEEDIRNRNYMCECGKKLPLDQCRNLPFIMLKPGNDTGRRGLAFCRKYHFEPQVILYLDQLTTAYRVCSAGLGACFISSSILDIEMPADILAVYPLDEEESERGLFFYYRKGRYMTAAMREFLRIAVEEEEDSFPGR